MYEYKIINISDIDMYGMEWWEAVQIFDKFPRLVLMKRKVWLFKRLLKKLS